MLTKQYLILALTWLCCIAAPQLAAQPHADSLAISREQYLENTQKQNATYHKWSEKASKRKWSHNLFDLLFDPPDQDKLPVIKTERSVTPYKPYEGRKIRHIYVKNNKPFGSSIFTDTITADNWFERTGNTLHTLTREKHIKNFLTIKEGDLIDPIQIADNEILIRALSYIDDVRLLIVEGDQQSVDLWVIVKDAFAWGGSYQAHDIDAHRVKIYNKNLWGRGHRFQNYIRYDPDKSVELSHTANYEIANIQGSFIRAEAHYENSYHKRELGFSAVRDFVDYKTKYAAGLDIRNVKDADAVLSNDLVTFENTIDYFYVDVWGGYSLKYNLPKRDRYARYRKVLTARMSQTNYSNQLFVSPDSNRFLSSATCFLLGFNTSKRRLYQSNLIYNYGKTEDIPYGRLAQILLGYEYDQFEGKAYLGFNYENAHYSEKHKNYYHYGLSAGSFLNGGGFREGFVQTSARYISRLYGKKDTKHRHFLTMEYLKGFNISYDFVKIDEGQGFANFESGQATGTKRFKANLENVFFTPHTLAGFRIVLHSNIDIGMTGSKNTFLLGNEFYAGIGGGIRLRNDNFVFETFQISFSYFPIVPNDLRHFVFDISSIRSREFNDLRIKKPEVLHIR